MSETITPPEPTNSTNPLCEPVHYLEAERERLQEGIALCLSGGGYRAMLFHVGVLWRLNQIGLLPKLNRISSVSGGSITAAVLALKWQNGLQFEDGVAKNFTEEVVNPIMSLAVAVVILWGSVGLLKESVWMSLAGVPAGIDVDQVEAALGDLDGVDAVHDLHIWPISTAETALTAHIVGSTTSGFPATRVLEPSWGISARALTYRT